MDISLETAAPWTGLGGSAESLEKVSFCGEARQSSQHITPLSPCLLPGRRTSPSRPHALHAPSNTIPTPMVQRPSPVHGPSPLPVLLGSWCPARWEDTENNPKAGTLPAPQPALASAPGSLGARTRDLWGDHGTNTEGCPGHTGSCCAVDPSGCLHTHTHTHTVSCAAQPRHSCACPDCHMSLTGQGTKSWDDKAGEFQGELYHLSLPSGEEKALRLPNCSLPMFVRGAEET